MTRRAPISRICARCRAAGRIVAGMLLCAAPATMAQDVASPDRSAQLLTLAQSRASLAAQQVEVSRQAFQSSTQRYEVGVGTFSDVRQARLAVLEADSGLRFAELDVTAIETGGSPVRMEVSAPLIGGRDFVSERLQIEFDLVSGRAALLEDTIEFTEARVLAGVEVSDSIAPLNIERAHLAAEAERIRLGLAQRQAYLAGSNDSAPQPGR
jgi:hypothetical protein